MPIKTMGLSVVAQQFNSGATAHVQYLETYSGSNQCR